MNWETEINKKYDKIVEDIQEEFKIITPQMLKFKAEGSV